MIVHDSGDINLRPIMIAIAKIAQGEELKWDYGETDAKICASLPWMKNS